MNKPLFPFFRKVPLLKILVLLCLAFAEPALSAKPEKNGCSKYFSSLVLIGSLVAASAGGVVYHYWNASKPAPGPQEPATKSFDEYVEPFQKEMEVFRNSSGRYIIIAPSLVRPTKGKQRFLSGPYFFGDGKQFQQVQTRDYAMLPKKFNLSLKIIPEVSLSRSDDFVSLNTNKGDSNFEKVDSVEAQNIIKNASFLEAEGNPQPFFIAEEPKSKEYFFITNTSRGAGDSISNPNLHLFSGEKGSLKEQQIKEVVVKKSVSGRIQGYRVFYENTELFVSLEPSEEQSSLKKSGRFSPLIQSDVSYLGNEEIAQNFLGKDPTNFLFNKKSIPNILSKFLNLP